MPQTYSPLASPSATRATLEEFGLYTKHRLGQNFLVNDAVIGKIVELAELTQADRVLEVGPGIGTLTVALLARAGHVVAVEADRTLQEVLAATTERDSEKFTLLMGDALKVVPSGLPSYVPGAGEEPPAASQPGSDEDPQPAAAPQPGAGLNKFVSNLPYQVAATLILQALDTLPHLQREVVMVQREVADRIAAAPGSKAYGAYTAKLALRAQVTGRFEVGPGNFMPPPHVDSAVVRLDRIVPADPATGAPLTPAQAAAADAVIEAAFAQRRKTIRNSMSASGYDKAALDAAFAACGIAPSSRAETLSPQDFVRLALALGTPEA